MKYHQSFWTRWMPAVLWMAVIFTFSNMPGIDAGLSFDVILKKTAHFVEYGVLALLLYHSVSNAWGNWSFPAARVAWILSALYAATDEIHQYFIPSRSARLLDVLIDSFGAFLALYLLRHYLLHHHPQSKRPAGS